MSNPMQMIHKTHTEKSGEGLSFVLSDETVDRMGDVIMADGWQLEDFRSNPIALWNHRTDFVIGTWKNLRIENKALVAELEPAPKGISERADEIIRFVETGVLRAVSVGFLPVERKERRVNEKFVGYTYTKQSLLESSVVAVPANPKALAVAKHLNLSMDARMQVFSEYGYERLPEDDHVGEYAALKELELWSPEEARKAKEACLRLAELYPLERRFFGKIARLMEEIETVRAIAEIGNTRRIG